MLWSNWMKSPRMGGAVSRHWVFMFLIPVGSRGRCHIGADKAVPPQHTQREPGPNKGEEVTVKRARWTWQITHQHMWAHDLDRLTLAPQRIASIIIPFLQASQPFRKIWMLKVIKLHHQAVTATALTSTGSISRHISYCPALLFLTNQEWGLKRSREGHKSCFEEGCSCTCTYMHVCLLHMALGMYQCKAKPPVTTRPAQVWRWRVWPSQKLQYVLNKKLQETLIQLLHRSFHACPQSETAVGQMGWDPGCPSGSLRNVWDAAVLILIGFHTKMFPPRG